MKLVILVSLFIFSFGAFAENSVEVKCFEKKDLEECERAANKLKFNDPKEVQKKYQFAFQACLLKSPVFCNTAKMAAEKISEDLLKKTKQKIEDMCLKENEVCDVLAAQLLIDGKTKEAIDLAQKFWKKTGDGPYIDMQYDHGSRDEAYKAMLESCEKGYSSCWYVFRYYPEHPQRKKIIESVERNCRKQNDKSGGSVCIDLGIYYFDLNEKAKGLELLELNCSRYNPTACEALIGIQDTHEKKDQAFKNFCSALKNGHDIRFSANNKFCSEKMILKINDEVIKTSKEYVDSWRAEIKTKNREY